ncbi:MAG: hypothetical protein HY290_23520, partial [Planctomycetia bacterium]|nr:hypothetical protein [Planctomycetia bacterium]
MHRRHTSASSMSLFPFLDTLVCTMGALILMLLAMTPRIKERALARQAAQAPVAAVPVAAEPEAEPEPEAPAAAVAAPPQVDFTAERQRRPRASPVLHARLRRPSR